MRVLTDSNGTRDRYQRLIDESATASVYQTLDWLRVFEALGYDVCFVEVDDETLVPFVCRGRGALRRAFSLPYDTYGGPVATADKPISYDAVTRALGIPSARVVDFDSRIESSSCRVEETSTHIVDLEGGYDRVVARYTKMNHKALRQAESRKTRVRLIEDRSELPAFYDLYRKTAKKYGTPTLPLRFFESIFALMTPKGLARFYLAHSNGDVAGANLVLRFEDKGYDWTWGYDPALQHLRPTNALIDRAIRDEIDAGSTLLNLGASPANGNGTVKFKENFGARRFTYKILSRIGRAYHAARLVRRRRTWLNGKLRLS